MINIENDEMIGKRFGRLVVLDRVEDYISPSSNRHHPKYRCRCDCGNIKDVLKQSLVHGLTVSCGCYHKEMATERGKKNATHGQTNTRLYHIWTTMRARCYYKGNNRYERYGGRGIKVCDDWLTFDGFSAWAYPAGYDPDAPRGECTLDRKDLNGDYCPDNCRWVNAKTQSNNMSRNFNITIGGETRTLKEWCEYYNVSYKTVFSRIRYCGYDPEEAIFAQSDCRERLVTFNGETKSVKEWEEEVGIMAATIRRRLDAGWSVEDALTTPVGGKRKKAG